MKKFTAFVFFSLAFALSIAAQTTASLKPISGGVLNGKAKTLAKPAYPAAARAVNAEGSVSVQVLIDEEGNVASAAAVSGHPLLRRAAEQAALESKFAPTMLSGQPVKVSGVIVYNFVGAATPENWVKTGYDLASYEKFANVNSYSLNSMTAKFPAEWTMEREQLKQLQNIAQNENPPPVGSSVKGDLIIKSDENATATAEKTSEGTSVKKMTIVRRTDVPSAASAEQIAITQNLTASLQSRLGSDPKAAWQFNLGIALGRAFSNMKDRTDSQSLLDALRQQIAAAPGDIAPEYLASANKIVALLESKERTPEERQQIGQLLSSLFKN
ncbi:MAG: energy transducer TonB [Acidobacteriota bacterium]|nr:energy transducer TonB [Acidobacteriota bacterium]